MQAVARILTPGAKGDYTIVLEGEQGLGKSRVARALGNTWFSDAFFDVTSKESLMQLEGVWIYELAEGEIFSRASTQRLKGFLTQAENSYVPKFSNRRVTQPRQTTFILTVNDSEYLLDPTGNRRFWPVRVRAVTDDGHLDADGLAAVRDQLWAEAVHRVKAGERHWPVTREEVERCREAEQARRVRDPWQAKIEEYIADRATVTIEDIVSDCLDIATRAVEQRDRNRVQRVLTALGWTQLPERKRTTTGARPRVYAAPARREPRPLAPAVERILDDLRAHGWTEEIGADGRRVWIEPAQSDETESDLHAVLNDV